MWALITKFFFLLLCKSFCIQSNHCDDLLCHHFLYSSYLSSLQFTPLRFSSWPLSGLSPRLLSTLLMQSVLSLKQAQETFRSNWLLLFKSSGRLKQAEKLKSCKMKEGWMKNDEKWIKNEEGWRMNDDNLQLLRGFGYRHDGWGQGGGGHGIQLLSILWDTWILET